MSHQTKQRTEDDLGGRVRRSFFVDFVDDRGSLLPVDFSDLPFEPKRVFAETGVPTDTVRGGHAQLTESRLRLLGGG